jgi:RND superfamily putative drug exporter
VRERAAAAGRQHGIRGYVTGRTALNIDISDRIGSRLPAFLVLIVGLALVLLLLVFRSLAVPLKAVAGFLLTIAATFGLSTWVLQEGHLQGLIGVDVSSPLVSFLPVLAVAILFGLAMDYEVFLVSRMRERHVRGDPPVQAVVRGFAASARVVTAAALIMIAVFSAFLQADDLIVKSIALALAFGVLADAFVVRMTFVPAVLALLGRHAWSLPRWLDRALPDVDIEGERISRRAPRAPSTGAPPPRRRGAAMPGPK